MTDGVFSADGQGGARFHPSAGVGPEDVATVQRQMRRRGLRWLHRQGHLDDAAVHALDAADHAGGWSVDASVSIPEWDRHGLERLDRLDDEHLRGRVSLLAVVRQAKPGPSLARPRGK